MRTDLGAHKTSLRAARSIFFFVCGRYKVRLWFWESFSLVKKMCLVLINVFIPELSLRILCSLYVMIIYGAINIEFTPWDDRIMHLTENLSIGALAVSFGLIQLLFYETVQQSEPLKNFIFVMLLLINLATVLVLLRMVIRTSGTSSGILRPILRFVAHQYRLFIARGTRKEIRKTERELSRLFKKYPRGKLLEEIQHEGTLLWADAEKTIEASEKRMSIAPPPVAPGDIQGQLCSTPSESMAVSSSPQRAAAQRRLSIQPAQLQRGVTTFDQIAFTLSKTLRIRVAKNVVERKVHEQNILLRLSAENGAPPVHNTDSSQLSASTEIPSETVVQPSPGMSWLSTEQLATDFCNTRSLVEMSHAIMLLPPEGDSVIDIAKKLLKPVVVRVGNCLEHLRGRTPAVVEVKEALASDENQPRVYAEQQADDGAPPMREHIPQDNPHAHVVGGAQNGMNDRQVGNVAEAPAADDANNDDAFDVPFDSQRGATSTLPPTATATVDNMPERDREQDRVKFLEVWLDHIMHAEEELMYAFKRLWRSNRLLKGQMNEEELKALQAAGNPGLATSPSAQIGTSPSVAPQAPQSSLLVSQKPERAQKIRKHPTPVAIARPSSQQGARRASHTAEQAALSSITDRAVGRRETASSIATEELEEVPATGATLRRKTMVIAEPIARSRRASRFLSDLFPETEGDSVGVRQKGQQDKNSKPSPKK